MLSKTSWLFAAAFLVAIVFVGLRSDRLVEGFAFREDMAAAAAGTVTALLAVTLFVERGMAVVNAVLFGDKQRDAEIQLMSANAAGASELSNVMANKERIRLVGAFLAGLFISAAGVRTLEGLLDTGAANAPTNSMLNPVDVILTAALIAGGGNGLAFLLQLAKDRLAPPPDPQVAAVAVAAGDAEDGVVAAAADPNFRARITTTG